VKKRSLFYDGFLAGAPARPRERLDKVKLRRDLGLNERCAGHDLLFLRALAVKLCWQAAPVLSEGPLLARLEVVYESPG
jgi:hypothetical protein